MQLGDESAHLLVPRRNHDVEHALEHGLKCAVDERTRRCDRQKALARFLVKARAVALAELGQEVLELGLRDRDLRLDHRRQLAAMQPEGAERAHSLRGREGRGVAAGEASRDLDLGLEY